MASQSSTDVERIAGAVANAVRTALQETQSAQSQRTHGHLSGETSLSGSEPGPSLPTLSKKRKFPFPSAIGKRKINKDMLKQKAPSCYIRDIMCLPKYYRNKDTGNIAIPRTDKRNAIAEAGLIGKVEFRSDMSAVEVRKEICNVFAEPMGLTQTLIEHGELFPFTYLQRTGPGSRTLCVPSVSSDFKWDGKKVSTLAKSGGIIYILADSNLDGLSVVEDEESDNDSLPAVNLGTGCLPGGSQSVPYYPEEADFYSPYATPPRATPLCATPPPPDLSSSVDTVAGEMSLTSAPHTSINENLDSPTTCIDGNVDHLCSIYSSLSKDQVMQIHTLCNRDLETTCDCLSDGPSIEALLKQMQKNCKLYPVIKIRVDDDDYWSDIVSFYKSGDNQVRHRINIRLSSSPAIDTGGVRRQLFTRTLRSFAENKFVQLFEGPLNHLRPHYSAEARSSGLFRVLGKIVGQSIQQDGIGFPFFSPLCYEYISQGEQHAIQHCSHMDVNAFAAEFITKVSQAQTQNDIDSLCQLDYAIDLLCSAGICDKVTVCNKDAVSHAVLQQESLFKLSFLLDQFKEGLDKTGLLSIIQAFPHVFYPMFTFTGHIDAEEVVTLLKVDESDPVDSIAMAHLQRFLRNVSNECLRDFLLFVTGTILPRPILVSGVQDNHGTIVSHTCSETISLPLNVFRDTEDSYAQFKQSLLSVLNFDLEGFNTV